MFCSTQGTRGFALHVGSWDHVSGHLIFTCQWTKLEASSKIVCILLNKWHSLIRTDIEYRKPWLKMDFEH